MESEHGIDGRKGLRAQNKQNFDVPSSSESEDDQDDGSELEDPGTESEEEKEDEDEEDEDGGKSVEAASQPPPSATKLFRCPLASFAKCKCLVKTLESVSGIKLYISDIDTIAVHAAAKDLQTSQHEPTKAHCRCCRNISASNRFRSHANQENSTFAHQENSTCVVRCHAKSVERLIYKEHKKLNSIVLDDVEITNELGPLQKYTGKISTRRSQSRCAV
jgi:hypothetical protein